MSTVQDWRLVMQPDTGQGTMKPDLGGSGKCDPRCQRARSKKCECRCGGRNHGGGLREKLSQLDQFNQPEDRPVDA